MLVAQALTDVHGGNADGADTFHRIAGIAQQVAHHFFQNVEVNIHRVQVAREVKRHRAIFAVARHGPDECIEVGGLWREAGALGKGQHGLDHGHAALGGSLGSDQCLGGQASGDISFEKFKIAGDDGKEIVKLMGEAACEAANGLQLAGIEQLPCGWWFRGSVGHALRPERDSVAESVRPLPTAQAWPL